MHSEIQEVDQQEEQTKRSTVRGTQQSIRDGQKSDRSNYSGRAVKRNQTRKQVTHLMSQVSSNDRFSKQNVDDFDTDQQSDDDSDSNSSQISYLQEKYQFKKEQEKMKLQRLMSTFKEETNQAGEDGDPNYDEEFCSTIHHHLPALQDIQIEQVEEENDILYGLEYEEIKESIEPSISLDVVPMNTFEKINTQKRTGTWNKIKKNILLTKAMISYIAFRIIKSFIFEMIVLLIILTNSVVLAMDTPKSQDDTSSNSSSDEDTVQQSFDTVFLILYSIEMVLKILGLGFIRGQGSYLRDPWNILDFIIVVTAYPSLLVGGDSGVDLSALRSLRVLRPLRTISSIKALKAILVALFSAFKLLLNTIVMLMFFFMIFAIGGLQLFSGLLKKRCFYEETGIMYDKLIDDDPYCNDSDDCSKYFDQADPKSLICGKMDENPNWGITNFDTFGWSFLQIFQIVTLEGWSEVMYGITKTYNYFTCLLFLLIVFIGAFFLMNLTLAIIKIKFSSAQEEIEEKGGPHQHRHSKEGSSSSQSHEECYNMALLKEFGIYKSKKIGYTEYDEEQESEQEVYDQQNPGKGGLERQGSADIRNQESFIGKINQLKKLKRNSDSDSDRDQNHPLSSNKDIYNPNSLSQNKRNSISTNGNNQQHLKYTKSGFANIVVHPHSSRRQSRDHVSPFDNFATLTQQQQGNSDDPLTILRNARRVSIANTISPYSLRNKFTSREQSALVQKSNMIQTRQKNKLQGAIRATIGVNRFKSNRALGTDITNEQLSQIKKVLKNINKNKLSVQNYQQKQTKTIHQKTNTGKVMMQGVLINNYRSMNRKKTTVSNTGNLEKSSAQLRMKKHSIAGSFVSHYGNRLQTGSSKRENTNNDEIKSDLGDIDFDALPKEGGNIKEFTELQTVNVNIMGLRKNNNPDKNIQKQQTNTSSNLNSNQVLKSSESLSSHKKSALSIPLKQISQQFTPSHEYNRRESSSKQQQQQTSSKNLIPIPNSPSNLNIQSSGLPPRNKSISKSPKHLDISHFERRFSKKGSYKHHKSQNPNNQPNNNNIRFTSRSMRSKEPSIDFEVTPTASQAHIGSFSNTDCNEEDSEESFDINLPSYKLHMDDDEDFTAEMRYNFKVHESLGILTQNEKKNEFKRKQTVIQQKRRKTVKKHSAVINLQKKMTMSLEDPNGEMAKLSTILDSRYLKCRVIDEYAPNSIEDILPSKQEKELKKREEEREEARKKKKFRFKFDFEGNLVKKEAAKHKKTLSSRNKQLLAPKKKNFAIPSKDRAKKLEHEMIGAKVQQMEDYTLSQVEKIVHNQARQKDTHDQYVKISEQHTSMLMKLDKKQAKLEAALNLDQAFITKKYFDDEDEHHISEQKQLKKTLNSFTSLNQTEEKPKEKENNDNKDKEKDNENENNNENEKDKKHMDMLVLFDQEIEQQFDSKANYEGLCEYDVDWSGEAVADIVPFYLAQNVDLLTRFSKILKSINFGPFDYNMWEGGTYGLVQAFRRLVLKFVMHQYFDYFIMLCVILNTLILALDGLVSAEDEEALDDFNLIFTIIFTVDMGLKLIGMGVVDYIRDTMNIFDGVIVILSLVELAITTGKKKSAISAFRSVRIFRTFRVLRVTKLIRSLRYMQIIIEVIVKSISSFFYIFMLLILFNYIYALLGMQAFGGKFTFDDAPRMNFDDFERSFMAVYQVMTMENWTDLLFACIRVESQSIFVTLIYLISWIFIGNYVLLNLFLSILLDSFDEQAQENEDLKFEIGEDIQIEQDPALLQNKSMSASSKSMGTLMMGQSSNNNLPLNSPQGGTPYQFEGSQQKIQKMDSKPTSNPMGTSLGYRQASKLKQIASSTIENQEDASAARETGLTMLNGEDDILELEEENKKKEPQKELIMFDNIFCEKAYCFISKSNCFRRFCYKVVKHSQFENMILFAIIISSLKLIVDTYVEKDNSDWESIEEIGSIVDYFFTCFFFLESLLKATAFGFVWDTNSYLRESWSQLDFFIVVASLFDVYMSISASGNIDLSMVKILRLLRILRPLRFISHNKNMKIVVTALLESVPAVLNVLIVVILIWMMFAILGINLMKDKLWYCKFPADHEDDDEDLVYKIGKYACEAIRGAEWTTYDMNFDNIFSSMMTLFVLSTLEGWPDYMWQFVDGEGPDLDNNKIYPPKKDNNKLFMLYFVVFIFIGSMFLLNLFIGVVQLNFMLAEKSAKNKFLTDDQTKWIELQKQILDSVPDYSSLKPPKNYLRKQIWYFCQGWILDSIVMTCIILNIVTMAIAYESATDEYKNVLIYINYVFTGIFIVECALKLLAYGAKGYFASGWNKFDFFVVLTSIFDIFLSQLSNGIQFLKVGPQLGRIFRVLRVTRLFRLIKKFEELKKLIQVTILTLPQLMNIAALLFLVFFIFSILGCFLFEDIQDGDVINDYVNFRNFHTAFILLFQCSTGEDWHKAMFDTMRHSVYYSSYFIIFVVLVQFIMINLFILIILNQFGENFINQDDDNPITAYQDNETSFKALWNQYTKNENGIRLDSNKLTDFYLDLEEPLGLNWKKKKEKYIEQMKLHRDITQKEIDQNVATERTRLYIIASQILMHMEVTQDHDGFIYFNDLLFFFYKNFFKDRIEFDETEDIMQRQKHIKDEEEAIDNYEESLKIVEKEEKATLKKSEKIKKKVNKNFKTRGNNLPSANPMVRVMFVNMAYRAWLNHSIQYFEKKQSEKQRGEDGEIPEILTSTESDTSSEEDSELEREQQDEVDENTSMIDHERRKKNKKIVTRAHQQLKYLEEKYPNLKYKNILNINTDIYQDDDGYFNQPDNIYEDQYEEGPQQPNTARSGATENSNIENSQQSPTAKLNSLNNLQQQQQQIKHNYSKSGQHFAINTINPPEENLSPDKKSNQQQYAFSESRRQQQQQQQQMGNSIGQSNNQQKSNNNNPILTINHIKKYQTDIQVSRGSSLGTPFNNVGAEANFNNNNSNNGGNSNNDSQKEHAKQGQGKGETENGLPQKQQQIINYNIQNNIIINNNYFYQENENEQQQQNGKNGPLAIGDDENQEQQQEQQQQQQESNANIRRVSLQNESMSILHTSQNNNNNLANSRNSQREPSILLNSQHSQQQQLLQQNILQQQEQEEQNPSEFNEQDKELEQQEQDEQNLQQQQGEEKPGEQQKQQ